MTEELRTARKDFSRLGLSLFTIAGVTSLLQILIAFLLEVSGSYDRVLEALPWFPWLLSMAPLYLVGIPLGLLVLRKLPAEKTAPTKMPTKQFALLVLMCMPVMYAGNILGTFLSLLLSGGTAENALMDYIMSDRLITFPVAVLVAPVMEEFIFRKQIIDRCAKYGEVTAILVSAATFALFHMNLFQFFYAFGLGILMAYAYLRTRMLRYPVIMHMVINFLGSVLAPWVLSLLDPALLEEMASGQMAPEQLLPALPGLLIYFGYAMVLNGLYVAGFLFLILRWKKRTIQPTLLELPREARFRTVWGNVGMILYVLLTLVFTGLALL